ncbi:MAG: hypothetical protein GF411_19210 [Candidatus Lokiarchaeota archaeon]|nr:hypothetical protein [Candidatus Lokiarchaeota archaeon]
MEIPNSGEVTGKERVVLTVTFCSLSFLVVITVPIWGTMGPYSWVMPFLVVLVMCIFGAYVLAKRKSTETLDKDGTRKGYGMVIYQDRGEGLYYGKYRPPETCPSCGFNLKGISLTLKNTLTIGCPECEAEVDCIGKERYEPMMEG